jgi:MerR family transcriptional regulator, thiopeptide resistance regulator
VVYTVSQLAELAGVSVRTLHHYDAIGLLTPGRAGGSGYRVYDDAALYRLQQILFYRELDLRLADIAVVLDDPSFDIDSALQDHRQALAARIRRLQSLIQTIDRTLARRNEEVTMPDKDMFQAFSKVDEAAYREEAEARWDPGEVSASYQRWDRYGPEGQRRIMEEGNAIYADLAAMTASDPASPEVQVIIRCWHEHMRYFYEPDGDRLRGLSQMYIDDERFASKFRALHAALPEFMQRAVAVYCDRLPASPS